jgi:hypothetical protein
LAGAGTQTAAVSFGGFYYPEYAPGGPGNKNNTEKFDGSSWTNSGVMNTGRRYLGGCGTQTAALAFGGNELRATPDTIGSTEEFNGSTWTNNPTGLIKMSIGGWAGKAANKKVLNVQASLPREGGSERAPSKSQDDNDLPY